MVTHIALFQWRQDISPKEIQKIMDDIKNLKPEIPEIINISCGENFSRWNEGYTHAVVVKVKNRTALDAYRMHPTHQLGIDFEDQYP